MPEPFPGRYRAAVANAQLGRNLLDFQRSWRASRDERFASQPGTPSFAELRERLVAAKDAVIDDHPRQLQRFIDHATSNGMRVHRAAGPEDAAAIIAAICREHGSDMLIKTKSMVSEEIELNHRLAPLGITAVETDVGEWIMQLRGETPTHMVIPAIHLNRVQVARTLQDATRLDVSEQDVAEQVRTVREALRPRFLEATTGMTGANALIGESGSVMIVTNEGNEGLLTAMCDVQIVLAGVEKLLPTLEDATTQVRLLARSATGQTITTYTTFISAPHDGQEVHVVLLDNGRTAMREDPDFRDALRCIRCAACASVCPPYQPVGGQVFGYIYSGAIGLVNTPFHHGLAEAAGPQSLCVSCNACQTVCPVDIPLPQQILAVRRAVVQADGLAPAKRAVFAAWRRRRVFNALADAGTLLTMPLRHRGSLRLPLPRRHRWRTVPAPAWPPAHRRLPTAVAGERHGPIAHSAARGLRVAFFVQCLTDRFSPAVAEAAVRLLAACGCDVVVPQPQHCCGLPLFDSGDWAGARTLARQTIAVLEATAADWIVSTANSCVVAIVHEFPRLFADEPRWAERAASLAARTVDLATFLDRTARLAPGALAAPQASAGSRYTYHPFCQSHAILHADASAQRLLREVCGITLEPLPEASVCCGFGGSTSMSAPEVSRAIVRRKLDNVRSTGATLLVSDNPGCLLHLRGAAQASGAPLRTLHLAEVLASCLDGADKGGAER